MHRAAPRRNVPVTFALDITESVGRSIVSFVNERILPEDKRRFQMTEDSSFYLAGTNSWTVDRERDMFLLPRTGAGPESEPGVRHWAFCWRNNLLDVRVLVLGSGIEADGLRGWERTRVLAVCGASVLARSERAQMLRALKEAFVAHRGLGIYTRLTSYEVSLEDEDGTIVDGGAGDV